MVGDEFEERVQYYKSAWLPARDIVYKAIESRKEVRCSLHRSQNIRKDTVYRAANHYDFCRIMIFFLLLRQIINFPSNNFAWTISTVLVTWRNHASWTRPPGSASAQMSFCAG